MAEVLEFLQRAQYWALLLTSGVLLVLLAYCRVDDWKALDETRPRKREMESPRDTAAVAIGRESGPRG